MLGLESVSPMGAPLLLIRFTPGNRWSPGRARMDGPHVRAGRRMPTGTPGADWAIKLERFFGAPIRPHPTVGDATTARAAPRETVFPLVCGPVCGASRITHISFRALRDRRGRECLCDVGTHRGACRRWARHYPTVVIRATFTVIRGISTGCSIPQYRARGGISRGDPLHPAAA